MSNITSFWADESGHFSYSRLPVMQLLKGDYFNFPFHPFLFYLTVKFTSFFSYEEAWLRLPSVAESMITLLFIFKIAKALFKRNKIALLSSFLFAISTYNIRLASEMRYTNLVLLFEAICLYYFIKIFQNYSDQKTDLKSYFLFVFFSFIGVTANYSFFWLYISIFIFFIANAFKRRGNPTSRSKNLYTFSSFAFIIILLLPWLPKILSSLPYAVNLVKAWIITPSLYGIYEAVMAFTVAYPNRYGIDAPITEFWKFLPQVIYYCLSFSLFLIIIIGMVKSLKEKITRLLVFLIIIPITISFVISQKYPIFIDYNLLTVSLGIILILTNLLTFKGKLGYTSVLIFFILNMLSLRVLINFETHKEDWKDLFKFLVSTRLSSKNALMIHPGFNRNLIDYYNLKNNLKPHYKLVEVYNEDIENPAFYEQMKKSAYQKICLMHYPGDLKAQKIIPNIAKEYKHYLSVTFPKSNSLDCYKYI